MINLKPLITTLKILMFIGLIATVVMMTAVVYRKLKEKYPAQVEENKWVFFAVGALMTLLMFFLYQKFIGVF